MFPANHGARRWAWLTLLCLLAPLQGFAQSDALDRPAIPTIRASGSVILAVARAGDRLVAAGERGLVLLSDDHGVTWRQAAVPVSVSITGVYFPTPHEGWAVGHSGVVLRSADGGATWTKQLDGTRAARLAVDDARSAPVHAAWRLRRGETLVRDGPDKPFLDVYFTDRNRGFVLGAYGMFLATRDGGATWQAWDGRVADRDGRHLYALRRGKDALYLAGERGALYRSTDGGETFVALEAPAAATFFGLVTGPRGGILLFGLRGKAFWSSDEGRSWRSAALPTKATLTAGLLLDDGSVVVVGDDGKVFRAPGSGQAFREVRPAGAFPFTGVVQAADRSVILCGARGLMRMTPAEWESPADEERPRPL